MMIAQAAALARSPHEEQSHGASAAVCPSRARPVDLVHLARQTAGDRILEGEVLLLMMRQIEAFEGRLELATADERRHIAHALKGAARNLGAFPLAQAAEALELRPLDDGSLAALAGEMRRTADFIGTLGH